MKFDLTTKVAISSMAVLLIIGAPFASAGLFFQATAQLTTMNTTSSLTTTEDESSQNATDFESPASIQNLTSSVELFPTLMQAVKSQMKISLNDAITIAMGAAGTNSSAITATIAVEGGFLVYKVFLTDTDNNIHRVMVDPGNGNVLLSEQIPPLVVGGNIVEDIPSFELPNIPLRGREAILP